MELWDPLPYTQKPATCPYPDAYQSIPRPHPIYWIYILILLSHLHLDLPGGLFHSGFPTKPVCTAAPIRATCPTHLILVDFITRIICGDGYRSWSYSLCIFLQSPVASSLLDPSSFLSTVFCNTQPMLVLQYQRPSFTPIQNSRQN
jgi:hypothetical protein